MARLDGGAEEEQEGQTVGDSTRHELVVVFNTDIWTVEHRRCLIKYPAQVPGVRSLQL